MPNILTASRCNHTRPEVPTALIGIAHQIGFVEIVNVRVVVAPTRNVLSRLKEGHAQFTPRDNQRRLTLGISRTENVIPVLHLCSARVSENRQIEKVLHEL